MGLYDTVRVKGPPAWTCSEGHDLTQEEWQTKDLGCTMGYWTLSDRLDGTPGPYGEGTDLPFTGEISVYTECTKCPVTFHEIGHGGNVLVPWVEFDVDLADGVVLRAERTSAPSPEQVASWIDRLGAEGPMTYAEALEMQRSYVPDRARSLRRFLTKLTAGNWRAEAGDVEIVLRMLEAEPALVHARDAIGRTPLHHLIEGIGSEDPSRSNDAIFEMLAELLLKKGADPNARDEKGLTALFLASTPQAARLLVRHGARVNEANDRGNTPLMHAVHNPELFDTLLRLGADPHQTNADGHSAHTWKMLAEDRKA